ncbi:MAG TPA: aminotransferase class III-fold pyridoxal phosphate-dependent enzyme, partial [Fibrobacteraceae bacterium]|nr:aminotransferase class III-fold pyridoxal phosphate-dependent enzyme [Fibrobacteraceae bacterium]
LLIKAGSGALTHGVPDSAGVPPEFVSHTLIAEYNDCEGTAKIIDENKDQLAAVIVEPVAANMGVVPPSPEFLPLLREKCTQHGILLVFDEVITGFRLGLAGAQGWSGISADITVFGKIIGGGMPVGAYGAKKELMSMVAPEGPVYQAGTLSGNPVAMAAGMATLKQLRNSIDFYEKLEARSAALEVGLRQAAQDAGVPIYINRVASLMTIFFTSSPRVSTFAQVLECGRDAYARFFRLMLERSIYLPPSPFEAWFLSAAHGESEIVRIVDTAKQAFSDLRKELAG